MCCSLTQREDEAVQYFVVVEGEGEGVLADVDAEEGEIKNKRKKGMEL
jgi:hypothetical protein